MKVSAQYAQEHLVEWLETAQPGQELEIALEGKPSAKLIIMPLQPWMEPVNRSGGKRILGAGVGELVLPTDEEWKAMDKELEDLMLNGPLFPQDKH